MAYLTENFGFIGGYCLSVLFIFLRYLLFAGSAFFVFYIYKKRKYIKRKIQEKFPQKKQVYFEIMYSFSTAIIFSMVGVGIYFLKNMSWAKLYSQPNEHGLLWLFGSFLFLVFFHDTWFYWTHKLMHHPRLFRIFHRVHHQSHNPTPWASFSFHPLEALVEIAFLPILVCLVPIHTVVIVLFSLFSLAFNVLGHLGFEIFPKGFTRHRLFRWLNTSTHHNLHHQRSNCNYGLYFNFWDTLMGTNHRAYHEVFEQVHRQRKEAA